MNSYYKQENNSLMKKLMKLIGVFAFLVAGTTGSFAQDANHSLGSRHLFKVNANVVNPGEYTHKDAHKDNTYTWKVFTATTAGVQVAEATDGNEFDFKQYNGTDLTLTTDGTGAGANLFAVGIQWNVPGDYLVQVTEQNKGTGSCTTLRNIHIKVDASTPDLLVLATDAAGTELKTEAELKSCSGFSGELVARGTTIVDEANKPAHLTERYYTLTMNTGGNLWHGQWGLTYTASATNTDGDAAIQDIVVSSANAGDVTIDKTGSTITVVGDNPTITLKVTVKNTPGANADKDITLAFAANATTPYIQVGVDKTFEVDADKGDNNAADYVIYASPATEDITID